MSKPLMIRVHDIVLPYKPLSNMELDKAVKDLRISHFRGIFMRDDRAALSVES